MPVFLNNAPDEPLVDTQRRISRRWLFAFLQGGSFSSIINLVTEVVGVLLTKNGGTGRASLTAHDVLVGNGTSPVTMVSPSTAGFVMTSNGTSTDPSFQAPATGGTVTHTGNLDANHVILGNGTADIKELASLGTTTTVLHGNAAGAPSFAAVALAADVSGNLPVTNLASGTGASSTTFWRGDGSWSAASGTGGGTVTNTGTLTANHLMLGNGATDITALGSLGTTTTLLHGNAGGAPSFAAVALTADVSGILPEANGGGFRTASLTLTDAQIKALPSQANGYEILADPGAGRLVIPVLAVIIADFAAGAYTNITAATNDPFIGIYTNNSNGINLSLIQDDPPSGHAGLQSFLSSAIKKVSMLTVSGYAAAAYQGQFNVGDQIALSGVQGNLVIFGSNGIAGDWTGGNAANTLKVIVFYTVVAV